MSPCHLAKQTLSTGHVPSRFSSQVFKSTFTFQIDYNFGILVQYQYTRRMEGGCIVCGKAFEEIKNLKFHIRTHNKGVSYDCNICHRPFEFLVALKEHLQSHMWTGPNCCDRCPMSFTTASDLVVHTKKHLLEEAGHKCKHCKRTHLKKHLKVHTFVEYSYSYCTYNELSIFKDDCFLLYKILWWF